MCGSCVKDHLLIQVSLRQPNRRIIHKLDGCGRDLLTDDGGNRFGCRCQRIEGRKQIYFHLRLRNQPENDTGNNGQGAFRAYQELSEVITGNVLHHLPSDRHHPS